MIIGYARVSTTDQDTAIQHDALTAAGAEKVFAERKSGTTTQGRSELERALDHLRPGDVLMVTRLDRLARSLADLLAIVERITKAGASLRATEQSVDTGSPAGRAFLQMLGVFAEFETGIRAERQREGIEKAKAEGRMMGRPKVAAEAAEVARLTEQGMSASGIAKMLGVSQRTVFRLRAQCEVTSQS